MLLLNFQKIKFQDKRNDLFKKKNENMKNYKSLFTYLMGNSFFFCQNLSKMKNIYYIIFTFIIFHYFNFLKNDNKGKS